MQCDRSLYCIVVHKLFENLFFFPSPFFLLHLRHLSMIIPLLLFSPPEGVIAAVLVVLQYYSSSSRSDSVVYIIINTVWSLSARPRIFFLVHPYFFLIIGGGNGEDTHTIYMNLRVENYHCKHITQLHILFFCLYYLSSSSFLCCLSSTACSVCVCVTDVCVCIVRIYQGFLMSIFFLLFQISNYFFSFLNNIGTCVYISH